MMKPTIYLHVGMHKTGTTSIQRTLFRNRRKLRRHGIHYLSISENHSTTVFPLFAQEPHKYFVNVRDGFDTPEKAARKNAKVAAALNAELSAIGSGRVVMSGEDILLLPRDRVAMLAEKLAPFADGVRVIVYVREPYGATSSAFQEVLRAGYPWEKVVEALPFPRYSLIENFVSVFGRDRVDIRVFDRAAFAGHDVLRDFFAAVGADPGAVDEIRRYDVNESLSSEAVLILRALNALYPLVNKAPHPDRAPNIDDVLGGITGRPFRLPAAIVEAARPQIERELDALHRITGRQLFSPDVPASDNVPDWNEEAVRALARRIHTLVKRKRLSRMFGNARTTRAVAKLVAQALPDLTA